MTADAIHGFWYRQVFNTMDVNDIAPVFHKDAFPLPVPSLSRKMKENNVLR